MKKKLLFVFPLFFLVALLLFLRNNREIEKDLLFRGNSFIEGVKIVHKKGDNQRWTLIAKRADIIEDEDKAELTDIVITIDDKGMTIHAENGLYDFLSRDLTLNRRIKAVTKDYTIIADSVEWNQSSGEIKTTGNVKVESKRFNVAGKEMEANSEQKVRILKDVKATFY